MKKIKILMATVFMMMLMMAVSFNTFAAGTGFSDATEISVNESYIENISASEEVDWYKFTISSPGSIHINFKHENLFDQNEYWTIALFNDQTNELSYYSFNGTDTEVNTYKIGLDKGTYYIRIRGGNWYSDYGYNYSKCFSTKTYELNLKYTKSNYWEKELNEGWLSATEIKLNKSYFGSTNDSQDVDYYRFTLSTASSVYLDFSHENLYDKNEYWTATIFDYETNSISTYSFNGSDIENKTFKVGLNKGTYYLRIRGGNWYSDYGYNYSKCFSTKTYEFKLNAESSPYWEKEIDNSFSTSNDLLLGKSYYGSIKDANDLDYYKVTLKKSGQIKIAFTSVAMGSDSEFYLMRIYDSKSNELVRYSVYGNKTNTEISTMLSAGEYYIRISGGNWYSDYGYNYSRCFTTNTYNFKVTIQVPTPTNLKYSYSTSAIKLAWNKVSGATGYKVYQYNTSKKKYVEIADTKKNSYKISSLKVGTTYKFAVRAYMKVDGVTYYSSYAKISASTAPAQVTGLKFKSTGLRTGVVSFAKVSGATGYQIYYSTSKNGTYKKLATTSKTTYTNKKFSSLKTYYVKVRAYKTVGDKNIYGEFSAVKSVKIK